MMDRKQGHTLWKTMNTDKLKRYHFNDRIKNKYAKGSEFDTAGTG